jgi:lysozyme
MTPTQMSKAGRATLRHHEGDVLKAYRCPAHIWTIGVGLTKGSGVIDPKPGMVITAQESERLTRLPLARNYAPRVRKHLDVQFIDHPQAAFDGGVSFDFNTGRIHNATWVKLFNVYNLNDARASLMQWVKGGGKVLPGLQRRRADEAAMIFEGRYPAIGAIAAQPKTWATFVIDIEPERKVAVREALKALGYAVGGTSGMIAIGAVRAFQADHDLTVDGLIGRATLSTLQREIDARGKSKAATATTAGGGAAAGGAEVAPEAVTGSGVAPEIVAGGGLALAAIGVIALAVLAYRYRDIIAVPIQHRLPRVAAWLRSF